MTENTDRYQRAGASLQRRFARDGLVVVGATYPQDLDNIALARAMSRLSADECAHIQQTPQRARRVEFVCGRLLLRYTLAQLLGIPSRTLLFGAGHDGKPYLAEPHSDVATALSFNLSHAGGHILLGVSRRGEIGVDIEVIGDYKAEIARRYFQENEYHQLEALLPEERARAFYRMWTTKEACLKAQGTGLRHPLRDVQAPLEDVGRSAGASWRRLDCGPSLEAVIAVRRRDGRAPLDVSAPSWTSIERLLLDEWAPVHDDAAQHGFS
jgi:phosphopantetheinyl transferase